MKKFASILLALIMVLAMSTNAFAASGVNSNDGTITIKDAVVGETYSVYQILKLESFDTDKEAYAYKAADGWADFLAEQGAYFNVDEQGYVTWKGEEATKAADAEKVAKAALAYAEEKKIAATDSKKSESTTVEFTGLNLGYYLVDSSLGALCSLNTTDKTAEINDKNPTVDTDKKVQEDSKANEQGNGWGTKNDASVDETVNFKAEVYLKKGTTNVVFHDKMDDGLTFNAESVAVKVGDTTLAAGTDYTLTSTGLTDGCTFEIEFAETYLASLTADTTVTITYSAALNKKAVAGEPEKNTEHVTYGDSQKTTDKVTKTYTWKIDVFKYTGTETALADAVFSLYTDAACTDANIVKFSQVDATTTYRHDAEGTVTQITTDATGKFTLTGLDSGTYYLKEVTAPAGYNLLSGPVTITVDDAGNVAYTLGDQNGTGEVKVLNNTGAELPETGGMGTTLFYIIGGALVVGAVVLLVTKRRMGGADR